MSLGQILDGFPAGIAISFAVVACLTEFEFEYRVNLPVIDMQQMVSNEMLGIEKKRSRDSREERLLLRFVYQWLYDLSQKIRMIKSYAR